jgi:hypothetical protein
MPVIRSTNTAIKSQVRYSVSLKIYFWINAPMPLAANKVGLACAIIFPAIVFITNSLITFAGILGIREAALYILFSLLSFAASRSNFTVSASLPECETKMVITR